VGINDAGSPAGGLASLLYGNPSTWFYDHAGLLQMNSEHDILGTFGNIFPPVDPFPLDPHAVLYRQGHVDFLINWVPPNSGWDLQNPAGLNLFENGYITGSAPFDGVKTEFVMCPAGAPCAADVPEPGSWALLLTVLGAAAYRLRRGRKGA
jgi:hypothetical protein